MKNKHKLEYNGHVVWFQQPDDCNEFREGYKRIHGRDIVSAFDGSPISENEDFYLVISNNQLFPNCFVYKSVVDFWGFEKIVANLQNCWLMARPYKHWFI